MIHFSPEPHKIGIRISQQLARIQLPPTSTMSGKSHNKVVMGELQSLKFQNAPNNDEWCY